MEDDYSQNIEELKNRVEKAIEAHFFLKIWLEKHNKKIMRGTQFSGFWEKDRDIILNKLDGYHELFEIRNEFWTMWNGLEEQCRNIKNLDELIEIAWYEDFDIKPSWIEFEESIRK